MEFREKTLTGIKAKKAEVERLKKQVDDLGQRSNMANYLGVALQMLGLLLFLAETVMGDRKEKGAAGGE